MNDYWNDPPEVPEVPECCGEVMEVDAQGACKCPTCGKVIPKPKDIEPEPEVKMDWDDRMVNFGPKCPHGNEWFACDACDHAADLAYDAMREKGRRK